MLSVDQYYDLAHLGVIEVSGPHPGEFLQGQLTCDVLAIPENFLQISALCDRKGRCLAVGHIQKKNHTYYFWLPKEIIPHVIKHLNLYARLSKIKLTDITDNIVFVGVVDNPKALPYSHPTSRGILLLDKLTRSLASHQAWLATEFSEMIPHINTNTYGRLIPQRINLDNLGAISFTKGCYVGQEVIARLHYLGQVKYQLIYQTWSDDNSPEGEIINQVTLDNLTHGLVIIRKR